MAGAAERCLTQQHRGVLALRQHHNAQLAEAGTSLLPLLQT